MEYIKFFLKITVLANKIVLMLFKVSSAHQGCISAVKWLIVINRIKYKVFVYIICMFITVYKYTDIHVFTSIYIHIIYIMYKYI